MFCLVPDCMGTCHASKREGPGRGATEEVVGLVRGPSEGFGMIGPLETVESGPRRRPLTTGCQTEPEPEPD